jgi:hypothetical protein
VPHGTGKSDPRIGDGGELGLAQSVWLAGRYLTTDTVKVGINYYFGEERLHGLLSM